MKESFFGNDFKFESYINDRLLEIEDESERKQMRELMKRTLIPFYKEAEEAYRNLERKILSSKNVKERKYEIITGIQKRKRIDITDESLYPMLESDMENKQIQIKDLMASLEHKIPCSVMKIFLRLDYISLKRLEKENRKFGGVIKTDLGEYPVVAHLKKNEEYIKKIEELYTVFEENEVRWNTVCAPYLNKIFDVEIVEANCPNDEVIKEISFDFQEYKDCIEYDMVPVWNVKIYQEKTGAYPEFALDRIHFDHIIYKSRFDEKNDYLIGGSNVKIWNIYEDETDIHIVCDEEEPVRWNIIELNYNAHSNEYEYPIFGNLIQGNKSGCVHTFAGIKKYITLLGYNNYFSITNIEQMDRKEKYVKKTYSMDEFMDDEIRSSNSREILKFVFSPKDRNLYLNYDILSYIVSVVSWILPEFECVGEIE